MKRIPQLEKLNDDMEILRLVSKLAERTADEWTSIVVRIKRKEDRYPKFEEFVEFISDEAEFAMEAIKSRSLREETGKTEPKTKRVLQTTVVKTSRPKCLFCKRENHSIVECYAFGRQIESTKQEFIGDKELCFSCLKPNHAFRECRSARYAIINTLQACVYQNTRHSQLLATTPKPKVKPRR